MQPTRFSYLLMSEDDNAMMVIVQAAVGNETRHNHKGLHAFKSDQTFAQIHADLKNASQEFALIQVEDIAYQTSDGALQGTLAHLY
ncbi:hypothetical protein ACIOWE_10390 [Pseudomonas sp. NPDC087598]|uniref:hypothetical protein n=1 Tax=Pseudomonas sp. NPDC087598 TaxID=3364440 RepID=UPI00380E36C3